jgi:hypothetical protein
LTPPPAPAFLPTLVAPGCPAHAAATATPRFITAKSKEDDARAAAIDQKFDTETLPERAPANAAASRSSHSPGPRAGTRLAEFC